MQTNSQRMNTIKKELQNPKNFQPNSNFDKWTKYAMIICNRSYDKKYVTHESLPAVLDDFKNAMHTVKMMGIVPENIFQMKDVSYDELEDHM